MKAKSIILLLLFAVSATGCGIYDISYGFGYEQLARIERGMNLKEVCDILGEPILRDLKSGVFELMELRDGQSSEFGLKMEK